MGNKYDMVFGKYVPLVDRIEDGIHHSFHKNFGPRRATWKRSHHLHLRGDHQQSGSPFQNEVVGCQVEETPQLGRQPAGLWRRSWPTDLPKSWQRKSKASFWIQSWQVSFWASYRGDLRVFRKVTWQKNMALFSGYKLPIWCLLNYVKVLFLRTTRQL